MGRPFLNDRSVLRVPHVAEARQRGRPARYTQQELLDVVVREFNARGYDATSMDDLARATGMAKSAVYHHVSGKEELLRRAVSQALDALEAVLDEPVDDPGDRLEHVLRRSVEVLVDRLPYVTLLLRVRGNTGAEREALARRRELDRRLAELVRDAVDAGQVRADLDPRLVARLLFGAVNGLAEWYRPGGAHPGREVADTLVALVFGGLRRTALGCARVLLQSWVAGRWTAPDGDGTPVLDAWTGAEVARVPTAPVPAREALEHARTWDRLPCRRCRTPTGPRCSRRWRCTCRRTRTSWSSSPSPRARPGRTARSTSAAASARCWPTPRAAGASSPTARCSTARSSSSAAAAPSSGGTCSPR